MRSGLPTRSRKAGPPTLTSSSRPRPKFRCGAIMPSEGTGLAQGLSRNNPRVAETSFTGSSAIQAHVTLPNTIQDRDCLNISTVDAERGPADAACARSRYRR